MKHVKSKLVIRELTEDNQLDRKQLEKVRGGRGYIFTNETLKTLRREDIIKQREKDEAMDTYLNYPF